MYPHSLNTMRPKQNGRHLPRRYIQMHFLEWKGVNFALDNNIPILVQIMAWRRPRDKPLSELMMVSLLTHTCICVTGLNELNDGLAKVKLLFEWWNGWVITLYRFGDVIAYPCPSSTLVYLITINKRVPNFCMVILELTLKHIDGWCCKWFGAYVRMSLK